MTKKKTPASNPPTDTQPDSNPKEKPVEETPFEAAASICSVLVVGLFILTFLAQNFVIPSGSMENTLLIGDHLVVDRITLAPEAKWMPLVHYREPRRGDIVVFIKPVPDDVDGKPQYLFLVKRLIGVPGDHIHLSDGVVYHQRRCAGPAKRGQGDDCWAGRKSLSRRVSDCGACPRTRQPDPRRVGGRFPNYVVNGDLVVPPGKYFMMGDSRHNSADSRFWGFVPRENIVGRPMFNYWSFKSSEDQLEQTGIGANLAWMAHVALHFFPTRAGAGRFMLCARAIVSAEWSVKAPNPNPPATAHSPLMTVH